MRKWSRASHPVSNYGPWAEAERLAAKAATTITVTAVASVAIVVAVVVVAGVAQRSVVSHFNCLSLFNFQLFCYCHHGSDAYTHTHTHSQPVHCLYYSCSDTHTHTHTEIFLPLSLCSSIYAEISASAFLTCPFALLLPSNWPRNASRSPLFRPF